MTPDPAAELRALASTLRVALGETPKRARALVETVTEALGKVAGDVEKTTKGAEQ